MRRWCDSAPTVSVAAGTVGLNMRATLYRADSEQPRWPPVCPHCGTHTERIARRWYERVLSLLLPARRYRCLNVRCGWRGSLRCD
jgi:hypothetical protein